MRTSFSCNRCRRSKVKCIHSGAPPCQRCRRLGASDCVLLRPLSEAASQITAKQDRRRHRGYGSKVSPEGLEPCHESVVRQSPISQPSTASPIPHEQPREHFQKQCVEQHILQLPHSVIISAFTAFTNKFPELPILNITYFMERSQSTHPHESKPLLAAVLGLVMSQCFNRQDSWFAVLLGAEEYMSYAEELLCPLGFKAPMLEVVQSLLIVTLYTWGNRHFQKAWMYCGMAIRMMQALYGSRVFSQSLDPRLSCDRGESMADAAETMTYWSCFVLERMISSGAYSPPMLPLSEMEGIRIRHPLSTTEFIFGVNQTPLFRGFQTLSEGSDGLSIHAVPDMTRTFEVIVAGFDIWAQIMKFVTNDGRRAPDMCEPRNCPWSIGSPWAVSRQRLERWRVRQHSHLKYPDHEMVLHVTLGHGGAFMYLNFLYYSSIIMLHREYFPFLPTPQSSPSGPVDEPLLKAEAPAGWWDKSAHELFDAAEQIARLLHDASECSTYLSTPFVGFCAFLACHINLYASCFPMMSLNSTKEAAQLKKSCSDYLHKFRRNWKLGDAWIKTLQHLSMLYERVRANHDLYKGATRYNFQNLHQSINEFRAEDRSTHQVQEIDRMERTIVVSPTGLSDQERLLNPRDPIGHDSPREQIIDTELSFDEQFSWPQWWSNYQDIYPEAGNTLFMD